MREVRLVQIGIGTVGGAVVEQVLSGRDAWRHDLGVDVSFGAIVTRAGALSSDTGNPLDDQTLRAALAARADGSGLGSLASGQTKLTDPLATIERLGASGAIIVVDTGAGDETAPWLVTALRNGGGAVLANKAPLALPWNHNDGSTLWDALGPTGRLRYEATCGAGLPVLTTLRALLDTHDQVIEIQGTMSGTLGAIFSDVTAGKTFSAAVQAAKDLGYTEPDPRDDLSGLDVARKALILARSIGRTDDLATMTVESLVPDHLAGTDVSIEAFLDRISESDHSIGERAGAAAAENATLKYVATVRADSPPRVGISAVPKAGVLGALQGPENIIAFTTERYERYPLTMTGPGAGAAVTAAGVLGDVLALARTVMD